jgi:hypothetical protein
VRLLEEIDGIDLLGCMEIGEELEWNADMIVTYQRHSLRVDQCPHYGNMVDTVQGTHFERVHYRSIGQWQSGCCRRRSPRWEA